MRKYRLHPQSLTRFSWELALLSVFVFFAWIAYLYLFRDVPLSLHNFDFFYGRAAVATILLAIFLTLVFYGTSFQVTPLRLFFAFLPPNIREYAERKIPSGYYYRPRPPSSFANVASVQNQAEIALALEHEVKPVLSTEVDKLSVTSSDDHKGTTSTSSASNGQGAARTASESENKARIEKDSRIDFVDHLLAGYSQSSGYLAQRMERRTNTYLILGIGMGFVGLTVWYFSVAHLQTKSTGEFLQQAAPRLTILLFIELLAGYFLQQYRIGVEDFKYFLNLKHRAEGNRVTYSILKSLNDSEGLRTFANSISATLPTTKLQSGETTTSIKAGETNENLTLSTLKVFGDHFQDIVKLVKNDK